jgi:nucleoside-triphosphatase THEP1
MMPDAGRIAAIVGNDSAATQPLLAGLVEEWRAAGAKIAGVIGEPHGLPNRNCAAGILRDIASGRPYPMYLEIAPSHTSCHIDAKGVGRASAILLDQIAAADLVVLNKFGKLETTRKGLAPAFDAALAAGKPLLTTVSDLHRDTWLAYAPGAIVLPAEKAALQNWWRAARTDTRGPFRERLSANQ